MNASEARELANAFVSVAEEKRRLALKEEQERIFRRFSYMMEEILAMIEEAAKNGLFLITTENLAYYSWNDMSDDGLSFTDLFDNYLSMLQLSLETDYGFKVERYITSDSAIFLISWD